MGLIVLPVVVPFFAAALLALTGRWIPRRLVDLFSLSTCVVCVFVLARLMHQSMERPLVYWFGGWKPEGAMAIGISFVVEPLGAGLAAFVSFLAMGAFLFAWEYFKEVKALFHTLMLVFIGAMNGFCLTGDLFNLFVWFELMTATSVALCGYKSEEPGPLQGAINFAVTNTVGAFLTLIGISLLYARTGALNLAQISLSLESHPPSMTFIVLVLLLVWSGFLVKGAAFPFHFWLADAHAVAPTPVCILFSGVMVELGLYAVAKTYWVLFSIPMTHKTFAIQNLLLLMGVLTMMVGAVFCLGQRHWKRLLAFSTISHVGVMLVGISLLSSMALTGTALYVLGHGAVKGALFVGAGILLDRFGSLDEYELQGKARFSLRRTAIVLLLAALGLCGLPPFGTFYGEAYLSAAAEAKGFAWLSWLFVIIGGMTGGAVLSALARDFGPYTSGLTAPRDRTAHVPSEKRETKVKTRFSSPMVMTATLFVAFALCIGISSGMRHSLEIHSQRFLDARYYQSVVFATPFDSGKSVLHEISWTWPILRGLLGCLLAVSIAGYDLISSKARYAHFLGRNAFSLFMRPFHKMHTGLIGDYLVWLIVGISIYGGVLMWQLPTGIFGSAKG